MKLVGLYMIGGGGGGWLHMCLLCTLSIDIDQDIAVFVKLKE